MPTSSKAAVPRQVLSYQRRYHVADYPYVNAGALTGLIEKQIDTLNKANAEFADKQMPDSACIGVTVLPPKRGIPHVLCLFEWYSPVYAD